MIGEVLWKTSEKLNFGRKVSVGAVVPPLMTGPGVPRAASVRNGGLLLPAMALSPSVEPLKEVLMIVVPVIPGKVPLKIALLDAISWERLFPVKSWATLNEVPDGLTEA